MAVLNIRNLPDEVHARLRMRAARTGRSMEAEARAILSEACRAAALLFSIAGLQQWVDQFYGDHKPDQVVEDFIRERRTAALKE